jgi:hypothetical protein
MLAKCDCRNHHAYIGIAAALSPSNIAMAASPLSVCQYKA